MQVRKKLHLTTSKSKKHCTLFGKSPSSIFKLNTSTLSSHSNSPLFILSLFSFYLHCLASLYIMQFFYALALTLRKAVASAKTCMQNQYLNWNVAFQNSVWRLSNIWLWPRTSLLVLGESKSNNLYYILKSSIVF